MKHIIDSEAIENLTKYDDFKNWDEYEIIPSQDGQWIKVDDLRALIASSPQADDRTLVDGDYELKLMLSAYKPQHKVRE